MGFILLTTLLLFSHSLGTLPIAHAVSSERAKAIEASPLSSVTKPAHKTTHKGPTDPKEVEAFADQLFNRPEYKKVAGGVIVIVNDGKVLLSKGYGYADGVKKVPMDAKQTLLHIGSTTKALTTTVFMKLVEQGKVDLDRDIHAYIDFKIPNETKVPLTARHLLSYSSGFDFADKGISRAFEYGDAPAISLEQFVKQNVPTVVRTPGTSYSYDNYAFMLQGYIVEKLTGVPFYKYGNEHLLKPLGMTSSSFAELPDMRANIAVGHLSGKRLQPFRNNPVDLPTGGMLATGDDMAKFMLAILQKGVFGKARILEEKSVQHMITPAVTIHPLITNAGLGFESFYHPTHNGQHVIGKGGDTPGFSSWMWLVPEQNAGAFIIFNEEDESGLRLRYTATKAFMDHYYPQHKQETVYLNPTMEQLKRYEGHYRDLRIGAFLTNVTVTLDKQLKVQTGSNIRLFRQVDESLFSSMEGEWIGFKQAANHTLSYLYNGKASWAEKVGTKVDVFSDIGDKHPYAGYIFALSRIGGAQPKADGTFGATDVLTRAQFVRMLAKAINEEPSASKVDIEDIKHIPEGPFIQSFMDHGIIPHVTSGKFEPHKQITRQEAAHMLYSLHKLIGKKAGTAKLSGNTDDWALEAVQTLVAENIYGPEVSIQPDGAVDFKSTQPLLRQEAAALITQSFVPIH
ncbi:serine hydrolase [Paenibacillus sp. 481]|uniref:serine hydrolase n=1 Tax=Paenibacillus sp. 481 TaxID=2835869 RepID=UPI001E41D9DC|nr:serine hydrolase [Paenibacillus sp. 481]UHA73798.1 serine hydrolase [Paenibacillus sp. 481]